VTGARRWPLIAAAIMMVLLLSPSPATASLTGAGARTNVNAKALAILRPASEPGIAGNVTVFATRTLLKPGVTVGQLGTRVSYRLRKPAWLFWEDFAHGYLFPHPSWLLLVDRSGRQVLGRGMSTYPLIDGRAPAFLRSAAGYFGASDAIYNRVAIQRPAAAATAAGLHRYDTERPGLGIITVGPRDDPTFKDDFSGIESAGKDLHINTVKAEGTVDGLKKAIEDQVKAGKYEILLYVGGHGSPAQSYYYAGKVKINTTPAPQVDLNDATVNGRPIPGHILKAADLAEILKKYPKVKFDVVVDSCFSGRFISVLSPLRNVAITMTATDMAHVARAGFGAALGRALKDWAAPLHHLGPIDDLAAALESDTVKQAIDGFHAQSPTENFPKVAPRPPVLTPIRAVFTQSAFSTVYTETAIGEDLSYQWAVSIPADPLCGTGFRPNAPAANQASWYHADAGEGGPCSHGAGLYDAGGRGHPGTVVVLVSNAYWTCAASYYGTQGDKGSPTGVGSAPQACQFKLQ
jgi:hypothetical protein